MKTKVKIIVFMVVCIFLVNNSVFATSINSEIHYSSSFNDVGSTSIDFSDDIFSNSSKIYNPKIAELSSILSATAYRNDDDYKRYINDAIMSLGFPSENTRFYNYDRIYTTISHRVGYTFSHKTVEINGSEHNLIFVVVRGTTVGEWYSNFAVSNGFTYNNNVHYGFNIAEIKMRYDFQNYMNEMNLSKDFNQNKILITGHSRGAAVANLFARDLTRSQKFCTDDNIYGYTFATPNVEKNAVSYENIFNFVFNSDFVTKSPLAIWGFKKNGTNIEFFAPSDPDFQNNELYGLMLKHFYELTGQEFKDYEDFSIYENAMNTFNELAPTVRDYYRNKTCRYPYITLYDYTILISYALTNGRDYLTPVAWGVKTLSEKSVYKPLTTFFLKNMIPNPYIAYAHSADTYIAWTRAYNEYMGF